MLEPNTMNSKPNITILDFGINNLFSIKKALETVGSNTIISSNKDEILNSDALILPGVGSYDRAMDSLKENDLVDTINAFAKTNKYVLGICLGMQLLMDSSEEFGQNNGLGLIKGVCKKFDNSQLIVPHIMWNQIEIAKLIDNFIDDQSTHTTSQSTNKSTNSDSSLYFGLFLGLKQDVIQGALYELTKDSAKSLQMTKFIMDKRPTVERINLKRTRNRKKKKKKNNNI